MSIRAQLFRLFIAGVLCAGATTGAGAGIVFEAVLDGDLQAPPTGSPGTGFATVTLNDAQTEATYEITYSGLLGPETIAHFHNALPGTNGPVLFTLPVGTPKTGVWPLDAAALARLLSGSVYVNVHTTMFPGGEIRGNLAQTTVPAAAGTWGGIKNLYR